jgi:hypothetical protein
VRLRGRLSWKPAVPASAPSLDHQHERASVEARGDREVQERARSPALVLESTQAASGAGRRVRADHGEHSFASFRSGVRSVRAST